MIGDRSEQMSVLGTKIKFQTINRLVGAIRPSPRLIGCALESC